MNPIVWIGILVVASSVVGAAAWRMAGPQAARRERERLRESLRSVGDGRGLQSVGTEDPVAEALSEGWIQRPGPSVDEVRQAAIGRVVAFLRGAVAAPLQRAMTAGDETTRVELEEAVGALQDLEFYASEMVPSPAREDLVKLAREVVREFVADSAVAVREVFPVGAMPAMADGQAFKDAAYLILHNAAEFGGGSTITVQVTDEGGGAVVLVRDRGPGFAPGAFKRAMDPFYSTSESGLGLGLARARQLIEGMGGQISLRNHPEGGAEVAVRLSRG